jgi:hypothetical protein
MVELAAVQSIGSGARHAVAADSLNAGPRVQAEADSAAMDAAGANMRTGGFRGCSGPCPSRDQSGQGHFHALVICARRFIFFFRFFQQSARSVALPTKEEEQEGFPCL